MGIQKQVKTKDLERPKLNRAVSWSKYHVVWTNCDRILIG